MTETIDTDAATLVGDIESIVEPGSTVYTDKASAYTPLKRHYHHESVKHSIGGEYVRGTVHVNGMESVWSVVEALDSRHLASRVAEASRQVRQRGHLPAQRGQLRSRKLYTMVTR